MKLPEYDNEESIPEGFRELYAEKDGKWSPAIDLRTQEETEKIYNSHKRSQDERRQYKEQLDNITKLFGGKNPEEIQKLLEERQDKEREEEEKRLRDAQRYEEAAELKAKRTIDTLKHQYEQAMEEIAKKDREREELYTDYQTLAIDQQLQHAAIQSGANPKMVDYLVYRARPIWRLDENRKPIAIGKTPSNEEIILDLTMANQMRDLIAEDTSYALPNRGATDVGHQRANNRGGMIQVSREAMSKDVAIWERAKKEATEHGKQIQLVD